MLSLVLWIVGLPVLASFSSETILGYEGVDEETSLTEANLFFSTWLSLFASFLLATSWLDASVTTTDWVFVSVVSIALVGSSISYYRSSSPDYVSMGDAFAVVLDACDDAGRSCKTVAFAFYLGLLSGMVSVFMIPLHRLGPCWHMVLGAALVCGWGGGVAFVTFSSFVSEQQRES
jgi:hypothetical protein